jgi:hypothetical protein
MKNKEPLDKIMAFRPPPDVRRLMARAQKDTGAGITTLIVRCLREGLSEYAGKKDQIEKEAA